MSSADVDISLPVSDTSVQHDNLQQQESALFEICSCFMGGGTRPPSVSYVEIVSAGFLSFIGIGVLSLLHFFVTKICVQCDESDTVQIVGSFGASAVLLFAAPGVPLAQPRNLIGGHFIAAVVGIAAHAAIGEPMESPVLAAPLAVSVSIMLMHATSCLHPPAGGTVLIAVIGSERMHDMGLLWVAAPIMSSALLMLLIAVLGNALVGRKYPNYWIG